MRLYIISVLIPIIGTMIYMMYFICDNCIKSCVTFTSESVEVCAEECGLCNFVDNRFSNWLNWKHTDSYSYLLTDEPQCKNNYLIPQKLEKNNEMNNEINRENKPNIVMIVLDDLDELISPYWKAMPFAKKLFKKKGTHFSNAFTSTSFCCPARCQIFTGMYGHSNGVTSSYGTFGSVNAFRKPYHQNGTRMMEEGKCINNEYRSIHSYLKKFGGYKTGIFGKYLNGFENDLLSNIEYVPYGWDQFDITTNNYQYAGHMYIMTEWDSENNTLKYKYYGREEKNYLTDVISEKSMKFIEKNKNDPLFMYIAPTAPHFPQTGAKRHKVLAKYWENQFHKYVESRKNYHSNESVETKSSWLKTNKKERDELMNLEISNWYFKKRLNIHKIEFGKRMSSLYAVDDMIKSIYLKLKQQKKLENTLWIMVSDNGFNMGSHKLYHKMAPYEESIRIPFYLSGPSIKKNYTDNRLVLLNDLTPTLLNFVGFKIPEHMDGINLMSNISRSNILIEYGKYLEGKNEEYTGNLDRVSEFQMAKKLVPKSMRYDVPPYSAIRTKKYLYVEYNNDYKKTENSTEYELYDIINDPYQIKNIYETTKKK